MTIRSFIAASCATHATSIAVPVVVHDGQSETVIRTGGVFGDVLRGGFPYDWCGRRAMTSI